MRFNPPPDWPPPPDDWSPPPGWEPDPTWPKPPPGWRLWIDEDAASVPRLPARLPWYRKTASVVLFLVFFFPVGLVVLWTRRDWSVRRRSGVTALVAVLLVIAEVTPKPAPAPTPQLSAASGVGSSSPSAGTHAAAPLSTATSMPASQSAPATSALPTASAPPSTSAAAPPVVATTAPGAPEPPTTTTRAPKPPPTTTAPHKPSTCGAPSNPYGYNFCGSGGFVTNPPGDICGYFNCIANFWNGRGYMVECKDGTYSMSGGINGTCSRHSGESRPVYSG